ncbi:MAG TPA: hypothetical protein VEG84_10600 [Thermoanaerobaculia bacterium]|nr:hypothetical protein [Thermoanaerobaculia bacterium]
MNARRFAAVFALLLAAGTLHADVLKKSLLSSDGTLYQVQTGLVSELGLSGPGLDPGDYAVVWSSTAQDGTQASGVIPGVSNSNVKTSLDLTYDEPTTTLVVLWREGNALVDKIRLAFSKAGSWTVADLLPNIGFPHAYNPQMLLTHQVTHTLDDKGGDVYTPQSILSIVWWEESSLAQARYASFFLNETIDPSQVSIYNLPDLVADQGPTSLQNLTEGSYAYPALQAEGPGGAILASFADLASDKQYVVQLSYATDLGAPGAGNMTWLRRRIPVVGIASQGPISAVPAFGGLSVSVGTVIGSSFLPTLYWQTNGLFQYTRFDGAQWSAILSLTLSSDLTYDQAVVLIQGMAQRN